MIVGMTAYRTWMRASRFVSAAVMAGSTEASACLVRMTTRGR